MGRGGSAAPARLLRVGRGTAGAPTRGRGGGGCGGGGGGGGWGGGGKEARRRGREERRAAVFRVRVSVRVRVWGFMRDRPGRRGLWGDGSALGAGGRGCDEGFVGVG